jgi:hypothetical protein
MGAWGIGLYSSDFAADLRTLIGAVARLPFEPDKLLAILRESEPEAADHPDDPDHSNFWLTAADQFARRGIDCEAARDRALAIIDGRVDLAIMAGLGMAGKDLEKRGRMLEELRARLEKPPAADKPRAVLKSPQPLLMEAGDALAFPVSNGHCINPYFPSKERMVPAWRQDGWGALVVAECGHVYGFLAWYRPLVVELAFAKKPRLGDLAGSRLWYLPRAGTCSKNHYRRMELESLGRLTIDPQALARHFPERASPVSDAASDISIANRLLGVTLLPDEHQRRLHARTPRIGDIGEVLSSSVARATF